jgi:hypothetical protein
LNRKLLILDIVLAAGVIYGGFQLRSQWVAAKARQAPMPGPAPKAGPIPKVAPLPQQQAVLPSGYKDIAIDMLFDASRNPNIPVDPPPPPAPPPVPPPLPSFHGMMDFGDPQGPIALITENGAERHEEFHAGEMIGAFKLVSFDRQEMTLDWNGKVIHKRLNEGGSARAAPSAAPPAGGTPTPTLGIVPGRASEQTAEAPKPQTVQLGPGTEVTETTRSCQPNDSTPSGAVADGYRKVVRMTALGSSQCFWTAVGK